MAFKCFLDPVGTEIDNIFGNDYAEKRGVANLQFNCDESEENRVIREMMLIKEDKLRYSQIKAVKVYGLGLRLHVSASIDSSEKIATSIAQNQIISMANHLKFKKKYKSGFGMNSFWVLLELTDDNQLAEGTCCFLDIAAKLFGQPMLTSTIFLLENTEGSGKTEKKELRAGIIKQIAQRMNCIKECVTVMIINPLAQTKLQTGQGETAVASMIKLFSMVSRQTYIDPNPFEPDGMDFHDAMAAVETIKKRYQLKEREWCMIINHVYTMVPN